jgi:hypothetical protein
VQTPIFSTKEYLNAANFNTAYGTLVSGDAALLGATARAPGLIQPQAVTLTTGAGLTVTGTFNPPFGIVFGTGGTATSGAVVQAHGVNTNQDTQTYTFNFSAVTTGVSSGAPITGYIAATYTSIQQGPYTVTGPPPGHPDYNPSFVPYTAYTTQVDSLSISAVSAVPDNQVSFEIARTAVPISSASTGFVSGFSLGYQIRAASWNIFPAEVMSGNLGTTEAGKYLVINGPTILPFTPNHQGLVFTMGVSITGTTQVISTAGSGDLIYGIGTTPATGLASVTLNPGTVYSFQASVGQGWQTLISNNRGAASVYNAVVDGSGRSVYTYLAAVSGTPVGLLNIPYFGDASGTIGDTGISSQTLQTVVTAGPQQVQAWCTFNLDDGALLGTHRHVDTVTVGVPGTYTVNTTGISLTSGAVYHVNSASFSAGVTAVPQICGGTQNIAAGTNPICRVRIFNLDGGTTSSGFASFTLFGI